MDFGEYGGERIVDVQEVAVESNTLSFEDYIRIRSFAFITEIAFNNFVFIEMTRYLKEQGVTPFVWLQAIWNAQESWPEEIRKIHESFIRATREELWETEDDILAYYRLPENYARLVAGEAGGNVIYRYKSMAFAHLEKWTRCVARIVLSLAAARRGDAASTDAGGARRATLAEVARS